MNLKINHRKGVVDVKYFNNFQLNLKYDSVASTFGAEFLFDPENQQHAEMACVSHYHECIVEHNGELLMTAYILSQGFVASSKQQLAKIGGYSKCGVFEDCDIPTNVKGVAQSEYLQYDGLTLKEIALKLLKPFGIGLSIEGVAKKDSNSPLTLDEKLDKKIDSTTGSVSQNIKQFLTELAVQRNVILSNAASGNLLFTEARTYQKPLFHVEVGVIATKIDVKYNGQGMHSQITVIKQADDQGGDSDSNEYTIYNPYCPIVYRPKVVVQSSGDTNTIEEFAKNALAAELKNITFTIDIDRWEVNNKLVKPNNIITIKSPENFIYNKATLFIESVSFKQDSKEETAILNCVLPEVYNRQSPVNIFIDPHSNFPRL